MKRPAIIASIQAQQVKIPMKNPGILEVPPGEKISDLPESHFRGLIEQKGWSEISKALVNLKVWNKEQNPSMSKWADEMQSKLSKWVKERRKEATAHILGR